MSPIPLGVLAASGGLIGTFELIQSVTIGAGGAASCIFSGLNSYSSTYQHLQIRASIRTNRSDANDYVKTWFNGVKTSGNYKAHFMGGNGSTVFSSHFGESDVLGLQPSVSGNFDTSGAFSPLILDIVDPYETSKMTTIRAFLGNTGHVGFASGVFLQTAAVSSFELAPWFGTSWVQNTKFDLYGMRASI